MVNIDTFGTKLWNPFESTEDKIEEDKLLDDATIEVYPDSKIEGLEPHYQVIFDPDFRTKIRQFKDMAKFSFNLLIGKV